MLKWLKKRAPAPTLAAVDSATGRLQDVPLPPAAEKARGDGLLKEGKLGDALACYQRARVAGGETVDLQVNIGYLHLCQGDLAEARTSLLRALALDGNNADALYLLGSIAVEAKEPVAAAGYFQQAIDARADFDAAHEGLWNSLIAAGDHPRAQAVLEHAVTLFPDAPAPRIGLGKLLMEQGRFNEAVAILAPAAAQDAGHPVAHNLIGLCQHHRGELDQAMLHFDAALVQQPAFAPAHNNRGLVLLARGETIAAVAAHRTAIALEPDNAAALNNLGNALYEQGEVQAAIGSFRQALALRPDFADALNNLGAACQFAGLLDDAIACYRQALVVKPNYHQARSNLLYVLSFADGSGVRAYLQECAAYAHAVGTGVTPYVSWKCGKESPHAGHILRVGFVSGDLHAHPVGFFLENLVQHLAPTDLQLMAYTTRPLEDDLTARIKPRFLAWKSIAGISDAAAAALIHADEIDVLIDLSGHTAHTRLPLFAWKPAPVQVAWLGYWASTGLPAIDYLLADPVAAPVTNAAAFTETLWHLPQTRLCFTPPPVDASVAPLPALANGHPTFGSFQSMSKISDRTLSLWARVLAQVPAAQLRLQGKQLGQASERQRLQSRLAAVGIDPARVRMVGPQVRQAYLSAYAEVDLLLDTTPFPGGTTTCEALWMGVPTLTLAGDTMLELQGASLLACAGLSDWIAPDEDAYVAMAAGLASDVAALARLRVELRQRIRQTPLFDGAVFARQFTEALVLMTDAKTGNPAGTPGMNRKDAMS